LSRKAVHQWVEKFSQGRSKVADELRPSHPVEIATEATLQWVEDFIRADRRITIDKIVLNRVKDSYINLMNTFPCVLFADIFDVVILFLVAWAYFISDLPSVFSGAAELSFSCLAIFVE
jgi:hypothetical protein